MAFIDEALKLLARADPSLRNGTRDRAPGELRDRPVPGRPVNAPSTVLVGRRFEHLVREALLAHPGEWDRFDEVWLWNDWPERDGPDTGIDLVARWRDELGGGLTAIQVKYGSGRVETREIDSFLAASGTGRFRDRLLVTSRPGIAGPGLLKLRRSQPQCQVLHTRDMDDWVPDWREFVHRVLPRDAIRFDRHQLRPYQEDALDAIDSGFGRCNRGKLILPCGTGKSFIALRAAERLVGDGGTVLYLVPSIALMGQTMREWSRQRDTPSVHSYLAVCSDATAGRRETSGDTGLVGDLHELAMPVTTDPAALAAELARPAPPRTMRVVFSTYHSTPVVAQAVRQSRNSPTSLPAPFRFGLIVADEAHRTTGLSEAAASSAERRRLDRARYCGVSPFHLVHHDEHLPAARRLYMTATPRVFTARQRRDLEAGDRYEDADSYSMDDPLSYGREFYRMSFADAIDGGWLSDYQVLVIARSTRDYEDAAGDGGVLLADGTAVDTESVVKLGGCWDALATPDSEGTFERRRTGEVRAEWGAPARSAIAFCGSIGTSKKVAAAWCRVTDWHRARNAGGAFLGMEVEHLDASTPAVERASLIDSLRRHAAADPAADGADGGQGAATAAACRVLTNVRVLSEGVDVPALDAVVFLESRSSPIDVTQAVGRVMRRAEGKKQGYIVIPVVVDEFEQSDDETAQERARRLLKAGNFKPVWDVVRALRAHDERIDYWLNAKKLGRIRLLSNRIVDDRRTEEEEESGLQLGLPFDFGDSFASLLLERCGDRQLYATWGRRAAAICGQVHDRAARLVAEHAAIGEAFSRFHRNLQRLLGEQQVSRGAALEMVAQHVVTIPIFDHVVTAPDFAEKNPLARALGSLLGVFHEHGQTFEEDLRPLRRAYRSMEQAFRGAASGAERLNVLQDIYESFFREAMPAAVRSLGIVYTPVEIVDFMLRSVDAVCRDQFGKGLTAEGVHVLDPFTGTGTFLNRLLTARDGDGRYLVRDEDLERKYGGKEGSGGEIGAILRAPGSAGAGEAEDEGREETEPRGEMHANEIVLLAYYIAALKIEEARHQRQAESAAGCEGGTAPAAGAPGPAAAVSAAAVSASRSYQPFGGMVLTDTFLMSGRQVELQLEGTGFSEAARRVTDQNRRRIRVIVGNPPWSAGRKAAGDEAVEVDYPNVSRRVTETYVAEQTGLPGKQAGGSAAGNLFVKAFRWASDRLEGDDGVVCFVHPNSLADGVSLAGMRKSLSDEFTDIHVVNLRGNAYKGGAEWEREGDKVFGQGSRNGVQITVLVRNRPGHAAGPASVRYAEVPDGLSREQKFAWLDDLGSVLAADGFRPVTANEGHDWVNLGDPTWNRLMPVQRPRAGAHGSGAVTCTDASGIKTNLDAYVYSFSWLDLCERVRKLIDEFNRTLGRWREAGCPKQGTPSFARLIDNRAIDAIKWTGHLRTTLARGEPLEFDPRRIRAVLYRPFTKLWLYEDYRILSAGRAVSRMFPRDEDPDPVALDSDAAASPADDTSLPPPPPEFTQGDRDTAPFSSPARRTRRSSEPWPPGRLPISAPPAPSRPVGPFLGPRDPDPAAVQPDGVRSAGDERAGRSERPGPDPTHPAVDDLRREPQSAAMLVSPPSNRTVFAALATGWLADLHALDPAARVLPRTYPS